MRHIKECYEQKLCRITNKSFFIVTSNFSIFFLKSGFMSIEWLIAVNLLFELSKLYYTVTIKLIWNF